ncbi:Protein DROOPING LEAF [Platanthera guangdongensis]|uniref:Protein DROOPING LEAF n=1 Tax=Platanthera guangdongensis TaxID=2320717 RepID=A0ABR2M4U0_9ASPA
MAAKNWAKCDPRGANPHKTSSENNAVLKALSFQHLVYNGYPVEAFDVLKHMEYPRN